MCVSVHGAQGARDAMDGGHRMRPDPSEEQCVKEIVTLELAIMAIQIGVLDDDVNLEISWLVSVCCSLVDLHSCALQSCASTKGSTKASTRSAFGSCSSSPCLPALSEPAGAKVLQSSFSWLLLAREAGASKRLPCLAERAGSPGKGTPVRVGNLPMKSECVHTKALTPGGSRTP